MRTVKIDPDNPTIIYWLVVALRKNGAIDMAKKHLESAKARLLEDLTPAEYARICGLTAFLYMQLG